MKAILERILQIIVLALFLGSLIGTPILVNVKYKQFLEEYNNAVEDEITYKVVSYTPYQNPNNKRIYYTVVLENGDRYSAKTIQYVMGSEAGQEKGFYLVMTKKAKPSYMQFFVSPFVGNAFSEIYGNKLVVVY